MEAKLFPPKANGNRLTRLVLCGTLALTGTAALHAQYSMDLSRINLPDTTYLTLGHPGPTGKEIRVNNLYMDVGGVPCLPVMGEIHYSRMHPRYWRDALMKMKASGIDVVATYCIWNLHEEFEGELSWEGRRDLRRFLKLLSEDNGMHRSVSYFADALCYTPKYLSQVIRQACGKSPLELITRRIIKELEGDENKNLEKYATTGSPEYNKLVDIMRERFGFTSLRFNTLETLVESIGLPKCKLCTHCFDGSSCF